MCVFRNYYLINSIYQSKCLKELRRRVRKRSTNLNLQHTHTVDRKRWKPARKDYKFIFYFIFFFDNQISVDCLWRNGRLCNFLLKNFSKTYACWAEYTHTQFEKSGLLSRILNIDKRIWIIFISVFLFSK